jgi:hypothetical protein
VEAATISRVEAEHWRPNTQLLSILQSRLMSAMKDMEAAVRMRYAAQSRDAVVDANTQFHKSQTEARVAYRAYVFHAFEAPLQSGQLTDDEARNLRIEQAKLATAVIAFDRRVLSVRSAATGWIAERMAKLSPRARTVAYYSLLSASLLGSFAVRSLFGPLGIVGSALSVAAGFSVGMTARLGLKSSAASKKKDGFYHGTLLNKKNIAAAEEELRLAQENYNPNDVKGSNARIERAMRTLERAKGRQHLCTLALGVGAGWTAGTSVLFLDTVSPQFHHETRIADHYLNIRIRQYGSSVIPSLGENLRTSLGGEVYMIESFTSLDALLLRIRESRGFILVSLRDEHGPVLKLLYVDPETKTIQIGSDADALVAMREIEFLGNGHKSAPTHIRIVEADESALALLLDSGFTYSSKPFPNFLDYTAISFEDLNQYFNRERGFDTRMLARIEALIGETRIPLGERPLTREEIELLTRVIFDEVRKDARITDSAGENLPIAEVFTGSGDDPDTLIQTRFGSYESLDAEQKASVAAHELGHALEYLLNMDEIFASMTHEEKMKFLAEIGMADAFSKNGPTSDLDEMFANFLELYIQNPDSARSIAPYSTKIIEEAIAKDPLLSRLFSVRTL